MVAGPMAAATAFVRSDESEGGGLGHFGDDRVAEVAQLAMAGLIQQAADSAA
jgi:hypothetical protein